MVIFMKDMITIDKLKIGEKAYITSIELEDAIRRRLWDLGLIEGSLIEKLGESPMGDPGAFIIKNTVLAIRKKDGKKIFVKRIDINGSIETDRK